MAESSNKHSIEDVLSSIRRLVSDEGASVAKPAPPTMLAEKLVLTPQFRVTEPEDPYQTIRALTQTEAIASAEDEPSLEDAPDADVLMPIFVSEQRVRPAFGAEPAETNDADGVDNTDDTATPGAVFLEAVPENTAPKDGGGTMDEAAPEALIAKVFQPAVVQEEATSDVMPALHEAPETITLDEAAMDEPFETGEHPAETFSAAKAPDPVPSAPLEAIVPMAWVPEVQASQDDIDAPANLPLQAIPFPHEKIAREADPETMRAEGPGAQADDVLDEETLREIIAEVVREEFAGQLGERITRNVRKLVRREIRQMLASEDLE
jgi:hypothetical protein